MPRLIKSSSSPVSGVRLDIGLADVLAISVVEPGSLLTGAIAFLLPLAAAGCRGRGRPRV